MSVVRSVLLTLGTVLGVVVLLAAGVIGVLFVLDWNTLRPHISREASLAAGRNVEIRGDLRLILVAWRPHFVAKDFVIGNPDWGAEKIMARAGELYMELRVPPLLEGRIELDKLRLKRVAVHLEKTKDGRANWQFGVPAEAPAAAAVETATPQKREEFPVLRRLIIEDGELTYRASGEKPIRLKIDRLEQTGGGFDDPVSLRMRGVYQGSRFVLDADFGSFRTLRDGGQPYPVKIRANLGEVAASFDGAIAEPVEFKGVKGKVTLKGRNFDDLHRLLGLPLPQSPPYAISGELSEADETFTLRRFAGKLGDSDISGDISVATGGARPKLTARIVSNAIAIKDIEGFWGAKADQPDGAQATTAQANGMPPLPRPRPADLGAARTQPGPAAPAPSQPEVAAAGGLIPDEPFRLDKLRAMDVDLDFQGKTIKLSGPALDDLRVRMLLEDGKLTLKPLELGVFSGRIAANLVLDGSGETPHVDGELDVRNIKLGSILAISGLDDKSVGDVFGTANLRTRGNTLHQLAGNATGNGILEMQGGQISALLMELMALDLPDVLAEWIGGRNSMARISCLLAPFDMRDGTMTANPWMFDTSRALVIVKGYIDLKTEKTQLSLTPYPKDFSFFNTATSIEVKGDLAERKASVDILDAVAKLALKTVLAPLQPIVSPPEEKKAQQARPCGKLLNDAQTAEQR